MITEKNYLEAKKIIADYELSNGIKPVVSGMLPINDAQIRAYGLLQLISKVEMLEPSPYKPENDIRKRNIEDWKREYYSLIGNLR